MQPDIVKAQASTLREWADDWTKASEIEGVEGAGEVAFLLRRSATTMLAMVSATPAVVEESAETEPAKAVATEELREG